MAGTGTPTNYRGIGMFLGIVILLVIVGGSAYAGGKSKSGKSTAPSSAPSYSGQEIIGIIVSSLLLGISVIGGLIYAYNVLARGEKFSPQNLAILTGGKALYYFIPYSLFLFGIISDGVNSQIKYFPAGFVGLFASFLNYLVNSVFSIRDPNFLERDSDICGIPGMSQLWSRILPQNILFSSTVLSYITSTNTSADPSSTNSIVSGLSLLVVFLIQWLMYYLNGCHNDLKRPWIYEKQSSWISIIVPPILAFGVGLLFGWTSGWGFGKILGIKKEDQSKNQGESTSTTSTVTSSAGTPAPTTTPASTGSSTSSTTTPVAGPSASTTSSGASALTSGVPHCRVIDDNYVCDSYTDGTLVTSAIVS